MAKILKTFEICADLFKKQLATNKKMMNFLRKHPFLVFLGYSALIAWDYLIGDEDKAYGRGKNCSSFGSKTVAVLT